MLSPKVDLTEHMDFNGDSMNIFSNIQLVEISDDEQELMSTEEYKWFTWWEGIFGRKEHKNQKREIFSKNINEFMTRCPRCGKPFRIPWENIDNICGVCRKCNDEIFDPSHNLPWKRNNNPSVSERSIVYSLFNSR